MTLWEYILLFMSVLVGGGIAFYIKKNNKELLQAVLSFSGAYILGICVLHLMPGIFQPEHHNIGIWILAGFFIQLMLEQLSGGVEHGHIHASHDHKKGFAVPIMLGLCLHAFIEGLPLSNYAEFHESFHAGHDHSSNHLLYGIILHKAPAAFALVLLLLLSNFKKSYIYFCLILFACMSPLGAFISSYIDMNPVLLAKLMAVVVGSFLHIATTILFEMDSTSHHRIPLKKLVAIAFGLAIALVTMH